jgi:cell division septation protein DedD
LADVTHDGDDGFHEIHLSGKQLVFLFMATTVVSVVIFLCGVLVGRGVRAERGGDAADPLASAASASTAAPSAAAQAGPPAVEPPPPAEGGELSYKKRLEGEGAPAETLKPQPQPQPRRAPAAEPAPPPSTVPPSAARPGSWVVQVTALRDRTVADSLVRRLASKGYPAFIVSPAAGAPAPIYRVQVGGFNDRGEAEQIKLRLEKEEQLKPYVTRATG